jgi:hypothetical protein
MITFLCLFDISIGNARGFYTRHSSASHSMNISEHLNTGDLSLSSIEVFSMMLLFCFLIDPYQRGYSVHPNPAGCLFTKKSTINRKVVVNELKFKVKIKMFFDRFKKKILG